MFYFLSCFLVVWGSPFPWAIQDLLVIQAAAFAIARGIFDLECYSITPTLYGNSGRELSGYVLIERLVFT
jgi:hypothetical protein